ncbi:MAG TPA: DUF58 domain-containing protein, partial [Thermoanaerobaculia bacterium]|nr:DUF58 domain-containing protein [Thermoanaerobaculia bacterium]
MSARKSSPEGIRITKVGLWYVLLTVIVAIAATNTGNNALYMVLAVMFATLIVSGLVSRENVRALSVELLPPEEIFANRPLALPFTLHNRGRLLPRWFLLFAVAKTAQPLLIPHLPRRGKSVGQIETMIPVRGRHTFPFAHVSSLFPFGFFKKGVRYGVGVEVLVFPEIFAAASMLREADHRLGDGASRRAGRGHDLHSLRAFRHGDDPRGIHWKQTAKTGRLIFMEREAEKSRRLSIVFDNAVGELADPARKLRFERLVSEAATAALDHLARGYQVELVTRDRALPFAGGPRQRLAILEALALIAP